MKDFLEEKNLIKQLRLYENSKKKKKKWMSGDK